MGSRQGAVRRPLVRSPGSLPAPPPTNGPDPYDPAARRPAAGVLHPSPLVTAAQPDLAPEKLRLLAVKARTPGGRI